MTSSVPPRRASGAVPHRQSSSTAKRPAARRPSRRPPAALRRRNRNLTIAAVAAVLAVVAILVGVKVFGSSNTKRGATAPTTGAPAAVLAAVTAMPLAQQVAAAHATSVVAPTPVHGAVLTADGKPELLYIGAEYCPYCAAERWAVVAALAHFGTWSGLGATHSSASDVYPNTPTLSFHGATYTSPYLTFRGVEETTNQPCTPGSSGCSPNGYTSLDQPTAAEQQLLQANDSSGSIPFIDLGGTAFLNAAAYSPQVLAGQTVTDVATRLGQPGTTDAEQIGAAAASFTNAVCHMTGQQPAAVCTAAAT